eukprot:862745_1
MSRQLVFGFMNKNNIPISIVHMVTLFAFRIDEKRQKYLSEVGAMLKTYIQFEKQHKTMISHKAMIRSTTLMIQEHSSGFGISGVTASKLWKTVS